MLLERLHRKGPSWLVWSTASRPGPTTEGRIHQWLVRPPSNAGNILEPHRPVPAG